jgi:hypothetical protein
MWRSCTPRGLYGQGTLIVLYRHTSFGTFGGGDCNISIPCCTICDTSGGNTTPGGKGGMGNPVPGSSTAPGGHTAPGGMSDPAGAGDGGGQATLTVLNRQTSFGSLGGAGRSLVWSTRRTDPGADAVSPASSTSGPAATRRPVTAASATVLMVASMVAAAARNGVGAGCDRR